MMQPGKKIDEFSFYKGTISSFCKENNISKCQFYYHKKRFQELNNSKFHAIALNEEETNAAPINNPVRSTKEIRIEIGKSNIYIPTNEIELL